MVSQELGVLGDQLNCNSNYSYIAGRITDGILGETWKNTYKNPYYQKVILNFISQGTFPIYKQWVYDGKQIPLEEIIQLATSLICNGVNSIEK